MVENIIMIGNRKHRIISFIEIINEDQFSGINLAFNYEEEIKNE